MTFSVGHNLARVTMNFRQQGQACANIYHVAGPAVYDASTLLLVSDALKDWWVANLRAGVVSQVTLESVVAVSLEDETAPAIENTSELPSHGTVASEGLPMNVTFAVRWLTALHGRSYRGRTYHIGLAAEDIVESRLDDDVRDGFIEAYSALIAAVNDLGGYALVVASYFGLGLQRATILQSDILSCSIDPVLDSQRRRLPGRGD